MNARLALTAVSSFVLGFAGAVGTTCQQGGTPVAEPEARSASDAEVATSLEKLLAAIERLPSEIQGQVRGEATAPTRQVVSNDASEAVRLASAIDRLEKLLDQVDASSKMRVGRGATESWKGPGYPSLAELVRAAEQEYSLGRRVNDKLTPEHILWDRQDVLDRYGPPSGIETGNGNGLVYQQVTFDFKKEHCWIEFGTQEGWVIEVGLHCKDIR